MPRARYRVVPPPAFVPDFRFHDNRSTSSCYRGRDRAAHLLDERALLRAGRIILRSPMRRVAYNRQRPVQQKEPRRPL